jgi:uncharacterized protein
MTNEERDIITQFIARVGGTQAAQPSFGGGSVPATTTQALPPVDPEADRFIADLFNRYPEARYRITQLAFVQEHALAEAQNRLQRMDWEVQQARQQAQQAPQQQQPSGSSGGFFSGLFGGGSRPAGPPPQPQQGAPAWNQAPPQQGYQQGPPPGYQQAPPPQQQYAPSYQPGMFQRSGSGFLGSALTTAAGVAGGLVAGNALMSLFSGSHGGGFGGGGFGGGGNTTGIENNPWGGAVGGNQGYVDQGTWNDTSSTGAASNPGYVDNGTWDTSGGTSPATSPAALPDNSSDPGWDTGGGSTDDTSWDTGGTDDTNP